MAQWDSRRPVVSVRSIDTPQVSPIEVEVPGAAVAAAQFVDDDTLVVVATRTYLLGRSYDDGVTQSGRFPVADLVTCDLVARSCAVSQRRAHDVDPSASTAGIVLAR